MIQSDPTHATPEPDTTERPAVGEDEAQSMSLLGGVAAGEDPSHVDDFDEPGVAGRGISRGTLLVILVGVLAFGAIYAMRVMQGDMEADGDAQIEARMEQILAKLSNPDALDENDPLRPQNMEGLFQDTDAIVASLATDLSGRQVPAEFVKKNPFALPLAEQSEQEEEVDDAAERRAAQRRELESEVQHLNLQSLMGRGANTMAVIDGEIYSQGDTVGSFRVESVDASSQTVTLEADDHRFDLTMGD